MRPKLKTYHFVLGKTASFYNSRLLIFTYHLRKLSNQSESVIHLFVVLYWLNVLLFTVSYVGGEVLDAIGRWLKPHLPHSNGKWSIGQCCYEGITAPTLFQNTSSVSFAQIKDRQGQMPASFNTSHLPNPKGDW
jgi:hypothetical protein